MFNLNYSEFTSLIDNGTITYRHLEFENKYVLMGYDDSFECTCKLFKPSSDATDYEEKYKEKGLSKLNTKSDIQKALPVIILKSEDDSFARATHDFCDRTTWYTESVRVEGEVPTLDTGLTYSLANPNVIDVVNKKVNRQDTLPQYRIVVYDDGVEISAYTVNHAEGKITLDGTPSGALTVDYSYENGSEWIIQPLSGKVLIIEHSEIQFAIDVSMTSPLRFEIWVYNPLFNPASTILPEDPTYNPMADAPRNQLRFQFQNVQYNGMKDLVNEANLGTGTIPAIDDLPECVVFPFNYASIKALKSSQGAQIRVTSVGDAEISGSFGTATFYCLTKDEE